MLTEEEARDLERWVMVARAWGESSQEHVRTSTRLSINSRDLADRIGEASATAEFPQRPQREERAELKRELCAFADAIEQQARTLRDDYLVTASALMDLASIR